MKRVMVEMSHGNIFKLVPIKEETSGLVLLVNIYSFFVLDLLYKTIDILQNTRLSAFKASRLTLFI